MSVIMDMHSDAPSDPEPAGSPQEPGPDAPRPEGDGPGLGRRQRAWLGMAAVGVALGLLWLMPGPEAVDPNAPPPSADADVAEGSAESSDASFGGKPAPLNYTLKDMNGIDVKLESFKGKVILLNFWATWCGPCRVEIPYLIELQRQYNNDLVILGVSVDDPAEKLKPYATEMKINYPLLVGNGRQDFQDAYGPFWGIPVTVFVSRDGRIHKKHSGIASKEQFEHEIMSLL
jgi:thiol-disulfide isomerase/thioredoxin